MCAGEWKGREVSATTRWSTCHRCTCGLNSPTKSASWEQKRGCPPPEVRWKNIQVETNYKNSDVEYKYGEEAERLLKTPEGYKVELFASEKEFPNLANPMQLSFDNRGRLWVAVMPTYPHTIAPAIRSLMTRSSSTRTPIATARLTKKPFSRTGSTCPSALSSRPAVCMSPKSRTSFSSRMPMATTRRTQRKLS